MLLLEGFVESFGNLLPIKRIAHPMGHTGQGKAFLLIQGKGDMRELLDQPFGITGCQPQMFAEGVGLALLTRDPLPDLLCLGSVVEDNQMFKDALGDFAFDLLPDVISGMLEQWNTRNPRFSATGFRS